MLIYCVCFIFCAVPHSKFVEFHRIAATENIDEIVAELEKLGTIEIERNNSIVCVVGRMEHGDAGLAASVFKSVQSIPIKMISYGASHRSLAMLISTEYKKQTLQSLNDGLFE